jgi:hypothetical protein
MGYGLSPYGLSSYGGVLGSISVASAWAISTHGVRVNLTGEPMHSSPFVEGDAFNTQTWTVDTIGGVPRTVIGVEMHSDTALNLTLLEPLGNHTVLHEVTAIGLLSVDGLAITSPYAATFLGVVQTMDPIDAVTVEGFRDRDLANPPFQLGRGLGAAGALMIGPDGDYDTEAGPALIRKLLLRRLGTPRGAIRHLPNYGVGLIVKEPVASSGDLVALRTEIESQSLEEPDVAAAQARLVMDRSGVLIVQLNARPKVGAAFTIRMGAANGRLVEF